MNIEIIKLEKKEDARGSLLKVLMNRQIAGKKEFGEIYLCVIGPGETRANHYHETTTEWFCAVRGTGLLLLKDVDTGETRRVMVSEEMPATVVIPPRVAHALKNPGPHHLHVLAYADAQYDESKPDTVPVEVET